MLRTSGSSAFGSDVSKQLRGFLWTGEEAAAQTGPCPGTDSSQVSPPLRGALSPPGSCDLQLLTAEPFLPLWEPVWKTLQALELSGCNFPTEFCAFALGVVRCLQAAAALAPEIAQSSLKGAVGLAGGGLLTEKTPVTWLWLVSVRTWVLGSGT